MIAEDLEELYKLLRGSRSATSVLDARALVQENKCTAAHVKLIDARESYMETRSRLMKQDAATQYKGNSKEDARNRKVLLRKQEKTREILKAFKELMPQIERLSQREEAAKAAEQIVEEVVVDDIPKTVAEIEESLPPETSASPARSSDFGKDFVSSYASSDSDEQMELINGAFGFREVSSEKDIHPDAVYFICSGGKSYLVTTGSSPKNHDDDETVHLTSLVDKRPFKDFTRDEFVTLGTRRKMVLLTNL